MDDRLLPAGISVRSRSAAASAWPVRRQAPRPERSLEQDLRAFEIETKTDLLQPRSRHRRPQSAVLLGVEHQKSAAAGADQLASDSSVATPKLVPLIDSRVAHSRRSAFLVFPVFMHQLAEKGRLSLLEGGTALQPQVFDIVEVVDHRGVARL